MDIAPQYTTLLIRKDGEEYGIFMHGGRVKKIQSVFPSDLFQHGSLHESVEAAMDYIGTIWRQIHNLTDPKAFIREITRQIEHLETSTFCSPC